MKISVRIPATSANLGPGFDCIGLALDLWNEFELTLASAESHSAMTNDHKQVEMSVDIIGEGAGRLPPIIVSEVLNQRLLELRC